MVNIGNTRARERTKKQRGGPCMALKGVIM